MRVRPKAAISTDFDWSATEIDARKSKGAYCLFTSISCFVSCCADVFSLSVRFPSYPSLCRVFPLLISKRCRAWKKSESSPSAFTRTRQKGGRLLLFLEPFVLRRPFGRVLTAISLLAQVHCSATPQRTPVSRSNRRQSRTGLATQSE